MTIKRNLFLFIAVILFLGFNNTASAQKSIELKYKLQVGDQFSNESNIEQTIQFEAMGQKVTLDQDMTFYMTANVDSVNGDLITQSTIIDHIVMDQQIFGMQIKYDSDDSTTFNSPMGTEFADQMNKLIDAAMISVMTDKGQVKKMDLSALGDAGEMSSNLNTANNYALYPDQKVKVGDSWEIELEPLTTNKKGVKINYTLKKATRKEVVLTLEGVLSGNLTNPEANGELEGTMKGEMTIDRKTGMVNTSNIQMDMTMEVEQNGMNFPAVVSSFIDTKIKKLK